MMTLEDAKLKVSELKGRFDAAFSATDKECIEILYWEVMGKEFHPTSCQQCYHDALVEIYLYLKRENKMKEKCKFRMRAGFIINCPAFEGGKIYTNDNLTDAVAEKYLAKFPKNADMFQELPKDFKVKFAKKTTDGDKGGKQGKSKTAVKKAAETTAEAASDNAVKDDTEKTEETVKDEAEKENAE